MLHFNSGDTNLVAIYQQLLLGGSTTGGGLWEGLDVATLFESGKALDDLLTSLGLS